MYIHVCVSVCVYTHTFRSLEIYPEALLFSEFQKLGHMTNIKKVSVVRTLSVNFGRVKAEKWLADGFAKG